jgi:L-amino acid N-acyltransferase YncA
MSIALFEQKHYLQAAEIYRQGIETGIATFQKEVPTWESWHLSHLLHSRLIFFDGDILLGWTALRPASSHSVHGGVAKVSIYIAALARGRGIGKQLLHALFDESEKNGICTLQSSIFAENEPSIRLHERCGFRLVGVREKIGQKDGVWRDILLMERRSKNVGL